MKILVKVRENSLEIDNGGNKIMKMKPMLILMLTLLTVSFILATPPFMWDENGIPIRQGVNIEWSRASAVLDNGTVIYVWSDTRYGGRDLWAQAVDETGVLWGPSGVMVDGKDDRQEDPVVIKTSDGNAIIAWIDFHFDSVNGGVFAQKINPQGELLWDESVPLCLADGVQISLNIVPDNDGGAYIIWQDQRSGTIDIYGVHIDSDGNNYPGWPENGLALASGPGNQQNHTFWEDGQGGAILAYVNQDSGIEDIYVLRVLSDGEIAWSYPLATGNQEQQSVRMSPFGANAFGFAYTDAINGNRNIYVKAIDIAGNFLWNGDAIGINPDFYLQVNPRVAASADGNFIVVWEDWAEGSSDLAIQKLDINGDFLWGQRPMVIVTDENNQKNPRIEGDATGGCYVVWDDARGIGHPEVDIYMQHVTVDGDISWEENGRPVAQVPGETFAPLIKPIGDNIIVVWGDMRTGSIGIYYQAYDLAGNAVLQDNGIPVYWGLSGDATEHVAVHSGDYVYVIWEDSRYANFGNQIKVQKIDSSGNALFEENGISIVDGHSGTHQTSFRVIPYHEGGLALTWTEQPEEFDLVYVQAIDANGNLLWGDFGVRPSTLDFNFSQAYPNVPRISYDGNGGYIVAWDETDQLGGFIRNIKAQRIVNGQRVWDDEGITIAYQTGSPVNHFLESVTERYFVWFRGGGADLYVKRLNEDGTVADGWDDYGNLICTAPSNRRLSKSVLTPEGLLIVWEDNRGGTSSIYGQLINENGQVQWQENGIPLIDYDNDQSIISIEYDDGYFYLSWRDARLDPGAQDVAMQKFDLNSNSQWGDPSPFVVSNQFEQDNPNMAKIGDNLLIAWENNYGEIGSDLFIQLANAQNGDLLWAVDGETLCDAEKRQIMAKIVPFDNQFGFVVWSDLRSSGKEDIKGLYAQKIDATFSNTDEITIKPTDHLQLYANYPNPFNPETNISFDLARNDYVSLKIYNLKGQLVKTLIDNEYLARGSYQLVWSGTDNSNKAVGSGVYFYKMESDNISQVRKMLLLK
ncbi:MAG: T9SS type A sorting domain-containing protein [Candidatus Cloacimonetes bacterium]|nr:T9SS type A sorting domain-containing protein [Candidatus Cloacimonadota bacterium]